MPRLAFLALATALVMPWAVPVHAADLATLGCVDEKLDGATRDRIGSEIARNLEGGTVGGGLSAEVTQGMRTAATLCAEAHGWSAAAARQAMLYTLAKLSLPTVERVAGERGLDSGALEALWFALPEEQRDKPLTPEAYRNLADAAIPEGEGRTQANGALLRTFFQFQSLMQSASVEFAKG